MKKKIFSSICAMLLIAGMLCVSEKEVRAEGSTAVDGSELTMDEQSFGYSTPQTRGIYYQSGDSSIGRAGNGLAASGGSTAANMSVANISVTVALEKLSGGSWVRVTSWSTTKHNTSYVSSSRNISVGTGSYYRTRSIHYANSDTSSSITSGIYI